MDDLQGRIQELVQGGAGFLVARSAKIFFLFTPPGGEVKQAGGGGPKDIAAKLRNFRISFFTFILFILARSQ